jgi:glycerol uptake facilitator-like aquaporin
MIGTALLLAVVVGSGIMGDRLCGNAGLALLANSLATGMGLAVLILALGPVSGAHFNPLVTLVVASQGGVSKRDACRYTVAQFIAAVLGVVAANVMFGEPVLSFSQHARGGTGQLLGEFIATFGLVGVIWACSRRRADWTSIAVGGYIGAAYWFTASTSFANPAVTVARSLTDTFTGIRPHDVPGFVLAQFLGAVAAAAFFRWLVPARRSEVTASPSSSREKS